MPSSTLRGSVGMPVNYKPRMATTCVRAPLPPSPYPYDPLATAIAEAAEWKRRCFVLSELLKDNEMVSLFICLFALFCFVFVC